MNYNVLHIIPIPIHVNIECLHVSELKILQWDQNRIGMGRNLGIFPSIVGIMALFCLGIMALC